MKFTTRVFSPIPGGPYYGAAFQGKRHPYVCMEAVAWLSGCPAVDKGRITISTQRTKGSRKILLFRRARGIIRWLPASAAGYAAVGDDADGLDCGKILIRLFEDDLDESILSTLITEEPRAFYATFETR